MSEDLGRIITRYKADKDSVYNTWFVDNEERLKAFRSIRRGVLQVIEDIRQDRFPNDFKGSSLEFVLTCITEQKQVFEGAAHPFYWKPKLRIPDIYENQPNKRAFGQFLENALNAKTEELLVSEILRLDALKIKGLGPAVASILYFLQPTLVPPFNTAIVNGFNRLFGDKKKLGSWAEYLKIRDVLLQKNNAHKADLSNDLGAIAGLLFEVGTQKLPVGDAEHLSEAEKARLERLLKKRREDAGNEREDKNLHSEMQHHLLKIGRALGYDVICASNDRSRSFGGSDLSSLCLPEFPEVALEADTLATIKLIDVLWFKKGTSSIIAAFEVEKSTSIYSGILRLTDLACTIASAEGVFYLVAPDSREKDVLLQLRRPALRSNKAGIKYILFSALRRHCDALCELRFDSHLIMEKIAKEAAPAAP